MSTGVFVYAVSWALVAGGPDAEQALAVPACVVGPGVSASLGQTVTDRVVTAVSALPAIRVIDRSLTQTVVQEQDLLLVSRAAEVLPHRFGDIGAERILVVGLFKTSAGLTFSLRLVDVATGSVLKAAVHQAPSERPLLRQCGEWTADLLAPPPAVVTTVSVDPALATLWQQLDNKEARRLLGRELDRAESVYRQYTDAVRAGLQDEAERLSQHAGVYLTDCLCLLHRAITPPAGMVFVPPGRVEIAVVGGKTRVFDVDGFFIDRCEFSRARYSAFLEATGREKPPGWSPSTAAAADLPVVGVDWHDAQAAARWRGMRLPTRLEYLRAAIGDRRQKYPWGAIWQPGLCNFARDPRHPVLEPVGSHPENASLFGMLDSVGGVFEWLDTWQDSRYWLHAPARNPRGPKEGSAKLAVGGSFRCGPDGCTVTNVQQLTPGTRKDDLGFRCVLPLKGDGKE
jgi:hypothetical protein